MKIFSSQVLNKGQNISSISINSSNTHIAISEIDITIHKLCEVFNKSPIEDEENEKEEEKKKQVDEAFKFNFKEEKKKGVFQINDNDSPVNILKFLNTRSSHLVTGGSDRLLKVYVLNFEKKIFSIIKTINLGSEIIELQVSIDDSYIICSVLDGYVFIIQSIEGKSYNICGKVNLNEELCYSISINKLVSSQFSVITETGRVEIYEIRYSQSNGLHEIQKKRKNIYTNEGNKESKSRNNDYNEENNHKKNYNNDNNDYSFQKNSSSSFKKITWGVNNMIVSSNFKSILKGEFILNYCKVYDIISDLEGITRSELLIVSSEINNSQQEKDLVNIYSHCLIGFNHEVTILLLSDVYYKSTNSQSSFLLLLTGDIYGNLTIWKIYDSSNKKSKFQGQSEKYCHVNNLCDASFSCFEFDKSGRFLYISNITGMVIIIEFLNITPIRHDKQSIPNKDELNENNQSSINPIVKRKITPTLISHSNNKQINDNEENNHDKPTININSNKENQIFTCHCSKNTSFNQFSYSPFPLYNIYDNRYSQVNSTSRFLPTPYSDLYFQIQETKISILYKSKYISSFINNFSFVNVVCNEFYLSISDSQGNLYIKSLFMTPVVSGLKTTTLLSMSLTKTKLFYIEIDGYITIIDIKNKKTVLKTKLNLKLNETVLSMKVSTDSKIYILINERISYSQSINTWYLFDYDFSCLVKTEYNDGQVNLIIEQSRSEIENSSRLNSYYDMLFNKNEVNSNEQEQVHSLLGINQCLNEESVMNFFSLIEKNQQNVGITSVISYIFESSLKNGYFFLVVDYLLYNIIFYPKMLYANEVISFVLNQLNSKTEYLSILTIFIDVYERNKKNEVGNN